MLRIMSLAFSLLTQHQKSSQMQSQQSQPLMWNPKQMPQEDDDESWEVRAFEQDSTNITWPPPSYTCAYCTRVLRSAQALGGHMNVHRRERARIQQGPPGMHKPTSISFSPTSLIPSQEIVTSGRVCFVYSLPNPNGIVTPTGQNSCWKPPSNFAPITPFVTNNLFPSCPPTYKSLTCEPYKFLEPSSANSCGKRDLDCDGSKKFSANEELDLELRLSQR